jgi:radical SAM protein with 4Fe4S-binding SPASM domain
MDRNPYVRKTRVSESPLGKKKGPPLKWLCMELTDRCNNNCIHCYINLPADDVIAKERELSTGQIKDILREAVTLGCFGVTFTGGEPLLREDFEDLYLFARGLGLMVIFLTNATLIGSDLTEMLARIPPLKEIGVSLYGMNTKSCEAVTRTPGSFEAAWRGISLLLEKRIPFVVKFTVLPFNRGDLKAFEAWASTIPWMKNDPILNLFLDLRCRRDSESKNRLIRELRLSPEEMVRLLMRKEKKHLTVMRGFSSKYMKPTGEDLFSCGAGNGRLCVDAYGFLHLCTSLRAPDTMYDLEEGSIKDAMTDFIPEIIDKKANNPSYMARCARCFLRGLCQQCPAKSWAEHGTLDTPVEYACKIAHVHARNMGLIREDEQAWKIEDWKARIERFVGKEPTLPSQEDNAHGL